MKKTQREKSHGSEGPHKGSHDGHVGIVNLKLKRSSFSRFFRLLFVDFECSFGFVLELGYGGGAVWLQTIRASYIPPVRRPPG